MDSVQMYIGNYCYCINVVYVNNVKFYKIEKKIVWMDFAMTIIRLYGYKTHVTIHDSLLSLYKIHLKS